MMPDPTRQRPRWDARNNPGRRATDRTRAARAGRRATDPAWSLPRAVLAGFLFTVDLALAFVIWYGAPLDSRVLAVILAGNALGWLAVAL